MHCALPLGVRFEFVVVLAVAKVAMALSALERAHVTFVEGNEAVFWCRVCKSSLSKHSCKLHMVKQHGLDVEAVANWVTVKDSSKIKHGRSQKCRLAELLKQEEGATGGAPEAGGAPEEMAEAGAEEAAEAGGEEAAGAGGEAAAPGWAEDGEEEEEAPGGAEDGAQAAGLGEAEEEGGWRWLPWAWEAAAPEWCEEGRGQAAETGEAEEERSWEGRRWNWAAAQEEACLGQPKPTPMPQAEEGYEWVAMPCWVKCHPGGAPVAPLCCHSLADVAPAEPREEQVGGSEECAGGEGAAAGHSVFVQPTAKSRAGPAPPRATEPLLLGLTEACRSWRLAVEPKVGAPIKYPLQKPDFVLDARFEHWLRQQRNLQPKSIPCTIVAAQRFLTLLEPADPQLDRNRREVVAAVYKQNLLAQLLETPLMKPERSWARKMAVALQHWCQFHIECGDREDDHSNRRFLVALKTETVGWVKRCSDAHQEQCRDRKMYDAARIEKMASVDELKEGARRAMFDLIRLQKLYAEASTMSRKDRFRANADFALIVWTCNWAGRDDEWAIMEAEHAKSQLAAGKDHFVCPRHKTARELGEAVKHLSPCTQEAARCYLSLPGHSDTGKLFRAAGGREVQILKLLKKGAALHLPGTQPPQVNLMRKRFTKAVLSVFKRQEVLDALETADKHRGSTALKHYCAMTFQEEADQCAAVYKAAMGDPPEWPSVDEQRAQLTMGAGGEEVGEGGGAAEEGDEGDDGPAEEESEGEGDEEEAGDMLDDILAAFEEEDRRVALMAGASGQGEMDERKKEGEKDKKEKSDKKDKKAKASKKEKNDKKDKKAKANKDGEKEEGGGGGEEGTAPDSEQELFAELFGPEGEAHKGTENEEVNEKNVGKDEEEKAEAAKSQPGASASSSSAAQGGTQQEGETKAGQGEMAGKNEEETAAEAKSPQGQGGASSSSAAQGGGQQEKEEKEVKGEEGRKDEKEIDEEPKSQRGKGASSSSAAPPVSEALARPRKRRRTLLTGEQRAWLMAAAISFAGRGVNGNILFTPHQEWFEQLRQTGIREGVLKEENTAEGLRSAVRYAVEAKEKF